MEAAAKAQTAPPTATTDGNEAPKPAEPIKAEYTSHNFRRGAVPSMQQQLNAANAGVEYVGGPSSHHTGGWHNAMGDGAVRFISENVDPKVLRNLTHRSDGEMLADF
jgi:hypothetical protein